MNISSEHTDSTFSSLLSDSLPVLFQCISLARLQQTNLGSFLLLNFIQKRYHNHRRLTATWRARMNSFSRDSMTHTSPLSPRVCFNFSSLFPPFSLWLSLSGCQPSAPLVLFSDDGLFKVISVVCFAPLSLFLSHILFFQVSLLILIHHFLPLL